MDELGRGEVMQLAGMLPGRGASCIRLFELGENHPLVGEITALGSGS